MSIEVPTLVVRADANAHIGTGHVMRCLTLADQWRRRRGRVLFLCRPLSESMARRLAERSIDWREIGDPVDTENDARQTAWHACEFQADWLVLDGYHLREDFQSALSKQLSTRATRPQTLYISDSAITEPTIADCVLNQNPYASDRLYPQTPQIDVLAGPSFALLREEFSHSDPCASSNPNVFGFGKPAATSDCLRILITFGGSDPSNATALALAALDRAGLPRLHIDVVVGPEFQDQSPQPTALSRDQGTIEWHVDVREISRLMRAADMAIAAAGSTAYELASCGVATILLSTAENQRPVAAWLHQLGCMIDAGPRSVTTVNSLANLIRDFAEDRDLRREMSLKSRLLVDGGGAPRVAQHLLSRLLRLRQATLADSKLLFDWQMDPLVRAASFTQGPPDLAGHVLWLRKRLEDPQHLMLIVESRVGQPLGCVRFQNDTAGTASVGISLDSQIRGRGWGEIVLSTAIAEARRRLVVERFDAWIKPENTASKRIFAKAGFVQKDAAGTTGEQPAERWQLLAEALRNPEQVANEQRPAGVAA